MPPAVARDASRAAAAPQAAVTPSGRDSPEQGQGEEHRVLSDVGPRALATVDASCQVHAPALRNAACGPDDGPDDGPVNGREAEAEAGPAAPILTHAEARTEALRARLRSRLGYGDSTPRHVAMPAGAHEVAGQTSGDLEAALLALAAHVGATDDGRLPDVASPAAMSLAADWATTRLRLREVAALRARLAGLRGP